MPTSHHDDIQCDSTPSCVIIYSISHTRVLEFQALNVMLLNTFMFCLYDLYFFTQVLYASMLIKVQKLRSSLIVGSNM